MRRLAVVVALVTLPLLSSPRPAPAEATFTGLGIPAGDFATWANDVSGDGAVTVGGVLHFTPIIIRGSAARWTGSGIERLPYPGISEAFAVSDDGSAVVGLGGPPGEPFMWSNAMTGGLGLLPGYGSGQAQGVSANGSVVVGFDYVFSPLTPKGAWRWTQASGMVALGDLPGGDTWSDARGVSADGSIVVGASFSGSGQEAFRWTQASGMVGLGDLSGGVFDSAANAISADGFWVVGAASTASGREAMRWSEATGMLPLGVLPGTGGSEAFDVSGNGSIIVGTSNNVAFVWDETQGMRDLKQVLEQDFALDLTDWSLTEATGVSADGLTIVGRGVDPSGGTEAWLATIPEPSTALLFGAGLVALAAARRRDTNTGAGQLDGVRWAA